MTYFEFISTVSVTEWVVWGIVLLVILCIFLKNNIVYSLYVKSYYGIDFFSSFCYSLLVPSIFIQQNRREEFKTVIQLEQVLNGYYTGQLEVNGDDDLFSFYRKNVGGRNVTVMRIRVDFVTGSVYVDGVKVSITPKQLLQVLNIVSTTKNPKAERQDGKQLFK